MKLKKGYTWKSIEGPARGKDFTVIEVTVNNVLYKSQETGIIYEKPRKEFEKYIQRVNNYWSEKTKVYKKKKDRLKYE